MTYHDRQHGVDFSDVILALVEDVDRDGRMLAAEAAHAARLKGLHAAAHGSLESRGGPAARHALTLSSWLLRLALSARRLSATQPFARAAADVARARARTLASFLP